MKTVRRLYFYAVVLISVEVVLWGLINLLRSITDETLGGAADALAQALALVLVGVPIFLFHWLWVQRSSAREEDERTASLRAVFFYSVLIGTLIPARSQRSRHRSRHRSPRRSAGSGCARHSRRSSS